jgi:cobalt-zinc-cadmium efflux system outer membrane protein
MNTRLSIALLLAGLSAPAMAQRSDLPPAAAVAEALDSHPTVLAANATTAASRAEAEMLRKGPHEVMITGSYIRRTVDREGGYDEFDSTVSRAIRLPHKAELDRKTGRLGIEEAQNNAEDARHQTSVMLLGLWHDFLRAGAIMRADTAAAETDAAALVALRRRLALRDAAPLEVDQAQSALALAQSQTAASRSDLERARVTLAAMFPTLPLPAEPPEPATPAIPARGLDSLHDLVISRSHEIRAAERRAEKFSTMVQRALRERQADPSIGVRLFSERGGAERGAGLVLSMPFGGGYRRAAADKAQAEANRARLELTVVEREVEATAAADRSGAATRMQAWEATCQSRDSATVALARTERGYKLGSVDLASLLYGRRQQIEAVRTEIEARIAALRAIMKLQVDSHEIWAPTDEAGE